MINETLEANRAYQRDKDDAYNRGYKQGKADAEPQWILCSERLPEEEEDVLVTVYFKGLKQRHPNGWNDDLKPSYYVEVANQIDGEWSSASDEYKIAKSRHEVIAWMPLPEPYKEKDNGDI